MEITATIKRAKNVTANVSRPSNVTTSVTRIGGSGTSDYEELENKPSINGVELVGDKSTADLLIDVGVTSVNGQTGAVVLDATDVGAIPDTTTFALGYDPDCSVGLAEVGDAVTDEPFYTPTGTIAQTMENISFMTGGTAELTASFYNGTLTLGVSHTTTTATKNVATSAPVFNGNGVHFIIEENE